MFSYFSVADRVITGMLILRGVDYFYVQYFEGFRWNIMNLSQENLFLWPNIR